MREGRHLVTERGCLARVLKHRIGLHGLLLLERGRMHLLVLRQRRHAQRTLLNRLLWLAVAGECCRATAAGCCSATAAGGSCGSVVASAGMGSGGATGTAEAGWWTAPRI